MSKPIKILYVDDEPINLKLFQIIFSKIYEVIIVDSADDALKILDNNLDITFIISDLCMPGMNGLEFITNAKIKYPEKKYSLLTGFHMNEEIQNALETGLIEEYFIKPIIKEKILSYINNQAS